MSSSDSENQIPFDDRKASLSKVAELRSYIANNDDSDEFIHDSEPLQELAGALFTEAPEEFVSRQSMKELRWITKELNSRIQQFLEGDGTQVVYISDQAGSNDQSDQSSKGFLHIFTVLGDRPFIINSIRECLLQGGASIEVLLHPILLRGGKRLSCCYVQLSNINPSEQLILKKAIERSLTHVCAATDDFTKILVRIETLSRIMETTKPAPGISPIDRNDAASSLRWISQGGFLLTGLSVWESSSPETQPQKTEITLGIHRLTGAYVSALHDELREDLRNFEDENVLLMISRLRSESFVQRRSRLLNITASDTSPDGNTRTIYQITGLLTSSALAEKSAEVPFLKRKLNTLLESEGAPEHSHNHKGITKIFNSMPKEEALRLDIESLRSVIYTILNVQNRNETHISVKVDKQSRSASVITIMPRDRFNTEVRHRVQALVEEVFCATPGSSEYFLDLSNKPHARFYFHVSMPKTGLPKIDISKLKTDIAELTRGWRENLEERIFHSNDFESPSDIAKKYGDAFNTRYQASQTVEDCAHDILQIEKLKKTSPIRISMRPTDEDIPNSFFLVLYKLGSNLTISHTLPILEHAGLEVLSENSFRIKVIDKDRVAIHRFLVRPRECSHISLESFSEVLAPGLKAIFLDEAKSDLLNALLISAELPLRSIELLRTYCSLLWQVNKFASKSVIQQALVNAPAAANQLWNMFDLRFNPELSSSLDSRQERFMALLSTFRESLKEVKDITHTRILRGLSNLLEHTTRTNFFQNTATIALKIHSQNAEIIPEPRPKYEIFVRGKNLEGVHLRAGKVARGGLRWSDRHQDFRQEILDLVKTQNVKNALIVPEGAKGGFVVKNLPTAHNDQQIAVTLAYKEFIRALLSITDNRDGEHVLRPKHVIAYDGEDPYLVVAADKGTATFSDLANAIATEEFNFWLGDAFASGGSDGYDHKLYGITARGAWESVKRHFSNLDIRYATTPFSVIGIGDMSGDVFGNGLIESDKIKLIAAFNHRHIFLDPNPDPLRSYGERHRLFNLQRSAWSDYDSSLISRGGGVFDRADREIPLSPEVRSALALPESCPECIDGEQLISHILKAPVDLLWNGGIGTYVKAKNESHADVNDRANDAVRINSQELRARVIGEGGNLGFTQRARIEFSRLGGAIFTDAIDNSGGVDLSDHEVNLKILFQHIISEGRMELSERNTLLKNISGEVVNEVLRHNYNHALILTLAIHRSHQSIDYFYGLLRDMTRLGFLNRQIDNLPEDEEIAERARKKEGLSAPELAVCIATVKRWIKAELEQSRLPEDPLLQTYLLNYFPEEVRRTYQKDILAHPLAKNIICTQVTNELVDSIGITFVHRMCQTFSSNAVEVVKATLAAESILRVRQVRGELRAIEAEHPDQNVIPCLEEMLEALRELTMWIMSYHPHSTLEEIVDLYQEGFHQLLDADTALFNNDQQSLCEERRQKYAKMGLSDYACRMLSMIPHHLLLMEVLWTTRRLERKTTEVLPTFLAVANTLCLPVVLNLGSALTTKTKWEYELAIGALRDCRRAIALISAELLKQDCCTQEAIQERLQSHSAVRLVVDMVNELKDVSPGVVPLSVLSRHFLGLPRHLHSDL